jgi:uncharacterized protein (TIGR00290 family)
MSEKILLSWGGGKDCALALYEISKSGQYAVSALLTTVTEDYDRISMHGVRRTLLEKQAASVGIPLEKVFISANAANEEYENGIRLVLNKHRSLGVSSVVFGDIFLEDLRKYREENLARIGMRGLFPLWKRDTGDLAHRFIDLGFRAIITCIDTHALGKEFVGREYDLDFLGELPPGVDRCGENGEFHSFVYDGPIFRNRILFRKGESLLRDNRFYFQDLVEPE